MTYTIVDLRLFINRAKGQKTSSIFIYAWPKVCVIHYCPHFSIHKSRMMYYLFISKQMYNRFNLIKNTKSIYNNSL